MLKKPSIIFLFFLLTGCATRHIATLPDSSCDYKVAGKCKHASSSDISGNTTLGHSNNEELPDKASKP